MTQAADHSSLRTHHSSVLLCHSARGMTLIEVLVATVILGLGVTGLLSAATLAMRNQTRSEQRLAALYVAQERLAEVEMVGPHVYQLGKPASGTSDMGGQTYRWNVQIEQQLAGELFSVQVEVTWSGRSAGSVQLATLLNDYEAAALSTMQSEGNTPGAIGAQPGGGR